jgi:hypothetical protein
MQNGRSTGGEMLKNWTIALIACASLVNAGPAAAEKFDFDQGVDVKKVVETIKAEVAKDRAASWTVMVYINAKNNLEKFGLSDTNEMEKVGSSDKLKIAVELGRIRGYDTSDGDWKGQRRFIIQKDSDMSRVASPILQEIPKADMGDWRHLVEFVNWAKEKAPAQKYMLIVWNHGSGWDKNRGDMSTLGISYDDETGNHMTTADMGSALAAIGKLDIYASDACLMQMAEVGYQIKDNAEYIVGSEETEPGDGYTYDDFLGPLAGSPSMSAKDLAGLTAKAYTAHYAASGQGATQSSIRAAALAPMLAKLSVWTDAVMGAGEDAMVKSAAGSTQDFYYSDNKDLVDFVSKVSAGTQNAVLKAKGEDLVKFLKEQVIETNAAYGSNYAGAMGLAVYLPNTSYNSNYDKLAWAGAGNWAKFAKWVSGLK